MDGLCGSSAQCTSLVQCRPRGGTRPIKCTFKIVSGGGSVKNPRVSVRGMRHLLNMYGLDVGLKRVGSPSTGTRRGQKRNRSEYHRLGEVSFIVPLVHVHF